VPVGFVDAGLDEVMEAETISELPALGLTVAGVTVIALGLLAMVRELFCECMLAAPSVTHAEAAGEHTDQSPSGSFSAILMDR